eukprot:gene49181-65911_t
MDGHRRGAAPGVYRCLVGWGADGRAPGMRRYSRPPAPVPTDHSPFMAKDKTIFTCTECGGTSSKWTGQCGACQQWNTMVETVMESG